MSVDDEISVDTALQGMRRDVRRRRDCKFKFKFKIKKTIITVPIYIYIYIYIFILEFFLDTVSDFVLVQICTGLILQYVQVLSF